MRDPYWRMCKVVRVVDGDTAVLAISLGWNVTSEHMVRLLGVDTPELHDKDAAVRARAQEAKAFTARWLEEHRVHDADDWLYERSEKGDSFGRYLVKIECGQSHDLGDALLAAGLAVPFMVGKS